MSESEQRRVRLLWPDHLGLARGKYLPGRHGLAGTGFCVSAFGLFYDRAIVDAPGAHVMDGLRDMHGVPDFDSAHPSWEDDGATVVMADLQFDGEPYALSPRVALQRALDGWAELGYRVKIGVELEGYLLQPLDGGQPRLHPDPGAMVYGTGPLGDSSGFMHAVLDAAERCGFDIESTSQEFEEGQYEFTLAYDDGLRAIDDAFLCRQMVREVAAGMGLVFTCLGKPFNDLAGSGVHINFSLVDTQGSTAMCDDLDPQGLSTVARQAIAGLCAHQKGLTALCSPTVNAYRRLQPGTMAGCWANWGVDHRNVTNRIPADGGAAMRIENRLPDGAVNLHLGAAAILNAARLGVVAAMAPPDPVTSDGFEDGGADGVARSADNLADALDDLEADTELVATLDPLLVANFVANKRHEAEAFAATGESITSDQLTAFEVNNYLRYH